MNEIVIPKTDPRWPSALDRAILYKAFDHANRAITFVLLSVGAEIEEETSDQLAIFVVEGFDKGLRDPREIADYALAFMSPLEASV